MQIVGGTARGTKLAALSGKTTRPTSQRSREAIFNLIMGGRLSPSIVGAHVIDAFAGTGAIGLEALSRGAVHTSFIEIDKTACDIISKNIEKMRVEDKTSIISNEVCNLQHWSAQPATMLFCDAPYAENLTNSAITHLAQIGALQTGALIIAETHKKEHLSLPDAFELQDRRTYGIAAISVYNWNG